MSLATINERDTRILSQIHPDMRPHIRAILDGMAVFGFPVCLTQGARTVAEQQALYAQGRTAPGKIVTNADGVTNLSNHQPKADGWGHAVDFAFLIDADHDGETDDVTWDEARPWPLLGAAIEAFGLVWGGRWKFTDLPHAEMK